MPRKAWLMLRNKPIENKSHDIIDVCSTDDDDDNHGDDDTGIDYDVKAEDAPAQAIRTGVRHRQNNAETTAPVRHQLADGWAVSARGYPVFMQRVDEGFPWRVCLDELRRYFIKHKHSDVPFKYVSKKNDVPLGWLVHQLRLRRHFLTESQQLELEVLQFQW